MPKLSIIIASYNRADRLIECLDSVYAGCRDGRIDERDFEVVVADSSHDGSMRILGAFVDEFTNIRVIHSDEPMTAGVARNRAAKKCRGEYIYCLDSDDRLHDARTLERVLETIGHADCYYAPWRSMRRGKDHFAAVSTPGELAGCASGVMSKIYRRKFYVEFLPTHPEAVAAHYLVCDRIETVEALDFVVCDWDDREENAGAISRTRDAMYRERHELAGLALTDYLECNRLSADYVSGALRNLAELFDLRKKLKRDDVRAAWGIRFSMLSSMVLNGYFIH